MSLFFDLLVGIWIIVPAYVANALAPVVGGGRPIDGGASLWGKRLLGDGKTWRGLIGATLGGFLFGLLQLALHPYLSPLASARGFALPSLTPLSALLIPLGAMAGDLGGSLIKRQSGLPRGDPAPLLDQLDFVVGALALGWYFVEIDLFIAVVIIAFTPIIHLTVNLLWYKAGGKRVPW